MVKDNEDMSRDFPHIQDIFDAMEINQRGDKVVDLINTFANLLGSAAMAMDALEDDGARFLDKQKLQMVINIIIHKLDDTMSDIITEANNGS